MGSNERRFDGEIFLNILLVQYQKEYNFVSNKSENNCKCEKAGKLELQTKTKSNICLNSEKMTAHEILKNFFSFCLCKRFAGLVKLRLVGEGEQNTQYDRAPSFRPSCFRPKYFVQSYQVSQVRLDQVRLDQLGQVRFVQVRIGRKLLGSK